MQTGVLPTLKKPHSAANFPKYTSARDAVFIRSHRHKGNEKKCRQESNSIDILFRNYQTEKQEWINTFPVQSLQTKRPQNLSLQDREDIRHILQEREKPA